MPSDLVPSKQAKSIGSTLANFASVKFSLAHKLILMIAIPLAAALAFIFSLNNALKTLDGYQSFQEKNTLISLLNDRVNLDLNQRFLLYGMYRATQNPVYKAKFLANDQDLKTVMQSLSELCRDDTKKTAALSSAWRANKNIGSLAWFILNGAKETRVSDLMGGPYGMHVIKMLLDKHIRNLFELQFSQDDQALKSGELKEASTEQQITNDLLIGLLFSFLIYFGLALWFKSSISSRIKMVLHNIEATAAGADTLKPSRGSSDEIDMLNDCIVQSANRIREEERQQAQTVRVVAEELERPLQAITSHLEDLREHGFEPITPKGNERFKQAASETRRLQMLVSDLRRTREAKTAQVDLKIHSFDMSDLAKSALLVVEEFAKSRGIKFELKLEAATVFGDHNRVMQAAINLLSNAIKFSPRDGVIRVGTGLERDYGILTVKDQGPGIPDQFKTKIFSRFEQSESTTPGGTGLGLAISKDLMEAQSGHLNFQSPSDDGKGSMFWISLPTKQKNTQPAGTPSPLDTGLQRKTFKQTLWQKGALIIALPLFIQFLMSIILYGVMQSLHSNISDLSSARRIANIHSNLISHVARGTIYSMLFNVQKDEASRKAVLAEQQALKDLSADLSEFGRSQIDSSKVDAIKRMVNDQINLENDLMAAPTDSESDRWFGPAHAGETESLLFQMEAPLLQTIDHEREVIKNRTAALKIIRRFIEFILFLSATLIALMSSILIVILVQRWARRIKPILANVENLAKGEPLQCMVIGNDELAFIDRSLHDASAKMAELDQFKAQMISVTSHELRTPLTSLAALVEMAEAGIFGSVNQLVGLLPFIVHF